MLAACISDPRCERAPEAYVRKFFDHYAPHFDESLTRLQYRAPQLIAERLTRSVTPSGNLEVLDAGCGTGLCGPLLKPFAARLVGVDLSAGLLSQIWTEATQGSKDRVVGAPVASSPLEPAFQNPHQGEPAKPSNKPCKQQDI